MVSASPVSSSGTVCISDHVSVGWAHGNLGNAMLGLDQKDKALDHLMTAFHMSAIYEGNPLAVGRAV